MEWESCTHSIYFFHTNFIIQNEEPDGYPALTQLTWFALNVA